MMANVANYVIFPKLLLATAIHRHPVLDSATGKSAPAVELYSQNVCGGRLSSLRFQEDYDFRETWDRIRVGMTADQIRKLPRNDTFRVEQN
jgi:hypothetical protein